MNGFDFSFSICYVDNLPERVHTGPSGSLYLMDLEVWMETLAYVTG
uniref:Uncharacterized protein n=1 Tax=Picea glauca TaxID=3330 RepID=A0A101M1T1_PICGL|nr:hypothetical protein ABT39_MTgene3943 [Picea glauca]